jgi:hypothetical protein
MGTVGASVTSLTGTHDTRCHVAIISKSAATMVATYNLPLVSDFPGNREAIDQGFTTRYVYEHIYKTPKII